MLRETGWPDLRPLHGVPLLVKDNIGTKGIPTTGKFNFYKLKFCWIQLSANITNRAAGSTALQEAKLDRDATVINKLRKAGAIILGKTNLSQWSNYRSSSESSSDGWSATGGQCSGVFCPNQNPGGSSSGAGVAVAVGLAVASIATDVSNIIHLFNSTLTGIRLWEASVILHTWMHWLGLVLQLVWSLEISWWCLVSTRIA